MGRSRPSSRSVVMTQDGNYKNHGFFEKEVPQQTARCPKISSLGAAYYRQVVWFLVSSQVNMVLKVIGDINMRSLIWRLDGWGWN